MARYSTGWPRKKTKNRMLKRLSVRNYVLIDSLETEFPEGLVIITGQTGAGKSILLGALSLLLGAKADVSMIGESSDNCVVEGEFAVGSENAALKEILERNDVEWDDGNLTVRRVINPTGRSRSFINDSPVSVNLLSELSSNLIDIHSQHQTLLLSDKHFQMLLLDRFAGDSELLEKYRTHYKKYGALCRELEECEAAAAKARSEYEYDKSMWDKIEAAKLRAGEIEELEQEQKQLANAEEIKENLCAAENFLNSVPSSDGEIPVTSLLRDAFRCLDRISPYVPDAASLSERIESCRLEIDDIAGELSRINADTEVSDTRLAEVEDRLSLIYSLFRTFSCGTVDELLSVRDALSSKIASVEGFDERIADLRQNAAAEKGKMVKAAAALSDVRKSAAGKLSEAIRDTVREMELPDAEFGVEITPAGEGPDGFDAVTYLFSATGRNPVEVSKCASGGELSRIMLALKAIMARYGNMPAMIFDEIDTGVSGSVADKMGSVICGMGNHMQVFAITHLPQVAAKGDAHYLVSKSSVGNRTVSEIKRLSDSERVMEIARMLSGSELTDAAVANAESLLSNSRGRK